MSKIFFSIFDDKFIPINLLNMANTFFGLQNIKIVLASDNFLYQVYL